MDYLIDRKFWNLVIKKLKPNTALIVKQGLKKNPDYKHLNPSIKKELVLSFPNKELFNNGFFVENCLNPISYLGTSTGQNYEIEQAMLEVFIETQGMSEKA